MVDGSQGTEPSGAVSLFAVYLGQNSSYLQQKKRAELTLPWLFLAIRAGITLQQTGGDAKFIPSPKSETFHIHHVRCEIFPGFFPPWSMQGVVGTGADPSLSCRGGARHTTAGS